MDGSQTPESALPQELTIGMASAKQRVEHQNARGEQISSMEVMEQRAREIARLQMTEDRSKWEGRFPNLNTLTSRIWKYGIGETATYTKEKNHAVKLLAESGIQMTTLPHSFVEQVDQLARQRITGERNNRRGGRVLGWMRDRFDDATFRESQLQQERVNIIRELRRVADNPNDPNNQQFLNNNQALCANFSEVLKGDYQASEALAKRVSSGFGNDVLHTAVGERKTQQAVELQGPVKDFFTNQVMTPLLREGLSNGSISEQSLMNARRQLQEFYFSPAFLTWYNNADPSVRANMNLSLSYGTDLIPMIQETLLPQMLQMKDHMQSAGNLDNYLQNVVLKVHAGTLEAGQKGVIGEGFAERHSSREITNQRVLDIYRNLNNRPQLVPDTYLSAAANRADLIGYATRSLTNSVGTGFAIGLGLYGIQRAVGIAGNTFLPLIGGSVAAGAFRAAQERRTFTREFEEHNVESELGYRFPRNAPRREQMRNLEFHKREMQRELTDPLQRYTERMKQGDQLSAQEMNRLLGFLSDTKARFNLMDRLGMGLLAASHPQQYQIERTRLELGRAEAMVQLRNYLNNDPNRLTDIQNSLGMAGQPIDAIITSLTQTQEDHLTRGTAINPQLQGALGNLSINQQESLERRNRSFNRARNIRTATAFAGTALSGIAGGLIAQEVVGLAKDAVGVERGATVLENAVAGRFDNLFDGGRAAGLGVDQTQELFNNPGQTELAPDTFLRSDGRGGFDLVDSQGNGLSSPAVRIESDGRVIFSDSFTNIPQEVQDSVNNNGWNYAEVDAGRAPGFGRDQVIEMFNTPHPNGRLEIAPGMFLQTDMDHHASLTDGNGNTIPTPAMYLTSDGHIVMDSAPAQMDPHVKQTLEGLGVVIQENKSPHFSTYHQIEQLMHENRHHTFAKGDLIFDINSDKDGQFSVMHYPSGLNTNGEPKVQIHGFARFDENGKLVLDIDKTFGSNKDLSPERLKIITDELRQDGWDITEEKISGGGTREVPVTDYYKQQGMVEQARRDLWHDNDTPMRMVNGRLIGADGKELQFHHRVLPDGRIELDFSQMRSQILPDGKGVNWDRTVDSQYGRLIQDIGRNPDGSNSYKNFEILVTPNKAADDAREVIAFNAKNHPELAQGYLRFDPNSPEARTFFTIGPDGKPIMNQYGNFQKPSFIEVAHQQANGVRTIISTSQGGDGIRTIEIPNPDKEVYHMTPPPSASEIVPPEPGRLTETEITPPDPRFLEQDILLPLPLSYRKPMESPDTPDRPERTVYYNYMYGGGAFGSPEWVENVARPGFSPELRNNPNYQPSPTTDTPWYLEQQLANPGYGQLIENLNAQETEPMDPNCEAAVCLAVAGHQEHLNIYRTLQTLEVQKNKDGNSFWDSNKAEVLLLVNWPSGSSPDQTMAEIQRFQQDYRNKTGKDFPVRIYRHEVTNGQKEVGLYKKMAFDLALLRKYRSPNPNSDIQLIMNDADMTFSSPTYLDGILKEMSDPRNQDVDALLGRQDLDPEVYQKYPTFHTAMRFWQFMDSLSRAKLGLSYTQGRNTVIRGSVYAALGGNRTSEFWADVEFGNLLKAARGGRNTIKSSNRNWVMVDPRREVTKFMSGEPVSATWADFRDSVRGNPINFGNYTDVDVTQLQTDPATIGQFEDRIKNEFEMILRDVFQVQPDGSSPTSAYYARLFGINESAFSGEVMQRALEFMGVKATIDFVDGKNHKGEMTKVPKITFQDTSTLRANLKRYQDEQRYNAKIKRHPLFGQPKTP